MKKLGLGLLTIVFAVSFLTACGKKIDLGEVEGKWAYIHDTETVAFSAGSNGKATLDGEKYSVSVDDNYITLSSGGKEEKLRYLIDKDGMLLYKNTSYTLDEGQELNGIIGTWSAGNGWVFEFTEEGTFKEDTYFPGYYTVDENAGTIKLIYNDHFEDTVIYYSLDGDKLTLQYPWRMVKIK